MAKLFITMESNVVEKCKNGLFQDKMEMGDILQMHVLQFLVKIFHLRSAQLEFQLKQSRLYINQIPLKASRTEFQHT